jgi:hypothetical protein
VVQTLLLQLNETRFPTFFSIALDYLPIQASAVPCEHVFSSSAETDTKRRNRIHPILMEALQMLKFSSKNNNLNFMEGLNTLEDEMLDSPDDEDDHLGVLGSKDYDKGIDQIIVTLADTDEKNKP